MLIKEFEIRWSDLDANRHLANTSYMSYAVHMRMSLLKKVGIGHATLNSRNIGPVVFDEHLYYFKEVLPDQNIQVSVALGGYSSDGMFFDFIHNYYAIDGTNLARLCVTGGWIDLKTRKLISLPKEILEKFEHAPKSDNFKLMTSSDTRKWGQKPEPLKKNT